MQSSLNKAVAALCIMIASVAAASVLTPRHKYADTHGVVNLEASVPDRFGEWRLEPAIAGSIVNPQQTAFVNQIYSQVLSKTYLNDRGERIMLSIAYGEDQRRGSALHYPEVCYPAQGFRVRSNHRAELTLPQGTLPVRRLETAFGDQRFEPLTYWVMVGGQVLSSGIDKKLAVLKYGLAGEIPDGLIFRVSSISKDSSAAYALQVRFIQDLLSALSGKDRARLSGLP